MNQDLLEIEILEDGTIKCRTSKVSAANHQGAEAFLQLIARLGGGNTTRTKRTDAHRHEHVHSHEGEHQHG